MTLKKARDTVSEWEGKLQAAQQALSACQTRMWDLALAGTAGNTAEELNRLQEEVAACEAALAGARQQVIAALRQEWADRAVQLRNEAAAHDTEAKQAAETLNELRLKMAEVQRQLESHTQIAITKRQDADDIEDRLQQGVQGW